MSEKKIKIELEDAKNNSELEMLLQQIIDMDVRAQNMTHAAENIKKASEKVIAERKKAMIDQYNERAEKRIAIIGQQEKENSQKELADESERLKSAENELTDKYKANGVGWVEEIVRRTVTL